MENEYTLYLDESKTVDNIFVIGGFAAHISKEQEMSMYFDRIKERVFKTTNEKAAPVFHATDYIKRYPGAFMDLIELVRKIKGVVFATIIKLDEIEELYGQRYDAKDASDYCYVDDPFNIAFESVIENYTHFLYYNNAFGKTIYEARNSENQKWQFSPDFLLKRDYIKIISNGRGMRYLSDGALQLCNTNFSVKKKKEDLPGLQIADNIAYIIGRAMSHSLKENINIEEIFDQIFDLAYNGKFDRMKKDMRHFYGIRILPEMFRTIPMERKGQEQITAYINIVKQLENKIQELKKESNKNVLKNN